MRVSSVVMVAGCGVSMPWSEEDPPCPSVRLVPEASSFRQYAEGAGRDPVDVEFEAEFAQVGWICDYVRDDERPAVTVELTIDMQVIRGPADTDRRAALDYFVAAVTPDRTIVDKRVFDVQLTFPADSDRVRLPEPEELVLHLPLDRGVQGWEYSVMLGFQLTEEQLEEQRRRSGR